MFSFGSYHHDALESARAEAFKYAERTRKTRKAVSSVKIKGKYSDYIESSARRYSCSKRDVIEHIIDYYIKEVGNE